jgi:hypothetical protein
VGLGEEPTKRLYCTQRAGLERQGLVVVSVGAGCASTWRHRLVKRLRNFQFVDSVISVHVYVLPLDSTCSGSSALTADWRARSRCCTVAWLARGASRSPETGGARLTIALKPATCGSTVAHAHRRRDKCCSSTQKSAGPAGRRPLREARAAPDRALAVLLDSLQASASTGIVK